MKAIDRFRETKAWDPRYNLPMVPEHNNPWIYLAYAEKIAKDHDESTIPREVLSSHFYFGCMGGPGILYRWPDKSGGQTSHDELIGLAYLLPGVTEQFLDYLNRHDGEYNVTGEESSIPERWNLYRFKWFPPYLRARAGYRMGLASQFWWSLNLLLDPQKEDTNETRSGRCLIWLMAEHMEVYPLCKLAIIYWRRKMNKAGFTPKYLFEKLFPDIPLYSELAKEAH